MKFDLVFCLLFLCGIIKGQLFPANAGASTSATASANSNSPSQLSFNEECEINSYVDNFMNLLLEDVMAGDTPGANPDLAQQLRRTSPYITQVAQRLRYGASYNTQTRQLLPNHRQRSAYFSRGAMNYVTEKMLEVQSQSYGHCFPPPTSDPSTNSMYPSGTEPRLSNQGYLIEMLTNLNLILRQMHQEEIIILIGEFTSSWNRFSRSVSVGTKSKEEARCNAVKDFSKERWSEFIAFLMKTFVNFQYNHESATWTCDFIRLFGQFRSDSSYKSSNTVCPKKTFDSYLYSKIHLLQDWNNCMDFDKTKGTAPDWCRAWRRIMLNSDVGILSNLINAHTEKFHQDVKTMVYWLSKIVSGKSPISSRGASNPTAINSLICYQNATLLSCPNNCQSNVQKIKHAKAKRSVSLHNDSLYEREWLKGMDNKLKCKCPESNGARSYQTTTVATTTTTAGNWLSRMFGDSWTSRCDEGLPDRNSPRCDELRRRRLNRQEGTQTSFLQ